MTLPLNGPISFNDINVELGKAANAQISLNDADVRALLGKPAGQISLSDGYGKSKNVGSDVTISSGIYGSTRTGYVEGSAGSVNPTDINLSGNNIHIVDIFYDTSFDYIFLTISYNGTIKITHNGTTYTFNLNGGSPGYYSFKCAVVGNVLNLQNGTNTTVTFSL